MKILGLKSKKILGISVTISPKQVILEEIQKYLEEVIRDKKKVIRIFTPNPEQIVLAQTYHHFAKILNQADISLPDGIGLAWAAGCKRIPGVAFMEDLVKLAAKRGYRVGLIGGRDKIAVKALECLQRKYPELRGWAFEPEEKTIEEIIQKIKDSKTRLVFVGLGAPKQEYFIARLALSLRAKRSNLYQKEIATPSERSRDDKSVVFMSVGGAFDMIAGRTPRAPWLVRGMGFEWLWRLCREPWRFRRQLALLKFLWLLAIKGLTL